MIEKRGLSQLEQDKLNIDPDFDFKDIAAKPFSDLTTNQIGMFKWTGIYHQLQPGYFMMRLRIAGGLITAAKLKVVADIAERYGQGELCITTRQCLQFHFLQKDDLHLVIDELAAVGITSKNACGDVVRNVTSCPLQGVCKHEIGDVRSVIETIDADKEFLDEQRNLSRKHKINVSGCGAACGLQLINCQSWVPCEREIKGIAVRGWQYFAGGGLGRNPYLAQWIFFWVPEKLVTAITSAAVEIHRLHGDRTTRSLGRLKIIVARFGHQAFALELIRIMRERKVADLDELEIAPQATPKIPPMPFAGESVVPQRQEDLSTVRVMIRRSEISATEAIQFATWAEQFGSAEIIFTARQNLQIRNVPDTKVAELVKLITSAGYRMQGHDYLPDIVACVGTTLCNLAVSDTPNSYRQVIDAFADDVDFWSDIGPLRIHMNGCPNSCAQHWIADIGLRGTREMQKNGSEEGFSIFVGGAVEGSGHIAEHVVDVSSKAVVPIMKQLLDLYLKDRNNGAEHFGVYARRVGVKYLRENLDLDLDVTNVQQVNQDLTAVFANVIKEAKP